VRPRDLLRRRPAPHAPRGRPAHLPPRSGDRPGQSSAAGAELLLDEDDELLEELDEELSLLSPALDDDDEDEESEVVVLPVDEDPSDGLPRTTLTSGSVSIGRAYDGPGGYPVTRVPHSADRFAVAGHDRVFSA
jgi:hypothetical protein